MVIGLVTQRQWFYLGRWLSLRLAKRSRRSFLRAWDAFYDFWSPFRTFVFWCLNPVLWWRVRSGLRLLRRTGQVRFPL